MFPCTEAKPGNRSDFGWIVSEGPEAQEDFLDSLTEGELIGTYER